MFDPIECKKLPDNSITDSDTIREIAIYGIETNDSSLYRKIKNGFEFAGLYPHVQKIHDIRPENMSIENFENLKKQIIGRCKR